MCLCVDRWYYHRGSMCVCVCVWGRGVLWRLVLGYRPQKERYCVLANASSNYLLGDMQIGTGCICLSFLRYEFTNVSSKHSDHSRYNGIVCIDLTFLHCVLSNEISNFLNRGKLFCVFSSGSLSCLLQRMHNHIGCIGLAFPRCAFSSASSSFLFAFVRICENCILDLEWYACKTAYSHCLHLFDFSPLCILKCAFKVKTILGIRIIFVFVFVFGHF